MPWVLIDTFPVDQAYRGIEGQVGAVFSHARSAQDLQEVAQMEAILVHARAQRYGRLMRWPRTDSTAAIGGPPAGAFQDPGGVGLNLFTGGFLHIMPLM